MDTSKPPRDSGHEFANSFQSADGALFRPRVYGAEREDGTWIGWLEFAALGGNTLLRTDRETTQPDRAALVYWATGLQPSYLEGALERAIRAQR